MHCISAILRDATFFSHFNVSENWGVSYHSCWLRAVWMAFSSPAQAKHLPSVGFCGLEKKSWRQYRSILFWPLGTRWLWVQGKGGGQADVFSSILRVGVQSGEHSTMQSWWKAQRQWLSVHLWIFFEEMLLQNGFLVAEGLGRA